MEAVEDEDADDAEVDSLSVGSENATGSGLTDTEAAFTRCPFVKGVAESFTGDEDEDDTGIRMPRPAVLEPALTPPAACAFFASLINP